MCFNRIIAPYHCAIYCISEGNFTSKALFAPFIVPNQSNPFSVFTKNIIILVFSKLDPADVVDLYDLSKYISMLLEQSNITVMQTNDLLFSQRVNLDDKFAKIDAIGVPYSLVLDAESLRTGLMKLRNRDTTLFETIHICHLIEYLPKIFQP